MNDNRNYDYTDWKFNVRDEYQVIADWITPKAKVIDLACGNGSLMKLLQEQRQADCEGLELAPTGVDNCLRHGLKARVAAIDGSATMWNGTVEVAVAPVASCTPAGSVRGPMITKSLYITSRRSMP